jgi:hypothetical protein
VGTPTDEIPDNRLSLAPPPIYNFIGRRAFDQHMAGGDRHTERWRRGWGLRARRCCGRQHCSLVKQLHTIPRSTHPTCHTPLSQAKLQLNDFGTGALIKELALPGIGSLSGFSGNEKSTEFFFTFTGFTGAMVGLCVGKGGCRHQAKAKGTTLT